ncbi:hypothetical protein GCM10009775_06760 [Microbacterium aoyamense]|uniref:Flagellar assembly factor FliW n=1 Tax=Microbacterium aoyamense TaxID=344166 RepID=A0ABN2PCK6_9MICO|nr:flagellar assembly protein FliW [Microbacterium aoyamense]
MTATAVVVDVDFASAPPGLAPHTAYTLHRVDGADGLYALHSRVGSVRLFLLDPLVGDYGYRPVLTAGMLAEIGAADGTDARVFVVVNPADDGVYLNLRAPIILHRQTGRAAQIILDDQNYPVRALLGR